MPFGLIPVPGDQQFFIEQDIVTCLGHAPEGIGPSGAWVRHRRATIVDQALYLPLKIACRSHQTAMIFVLLRALPFGANIAVRTYRPKKFVVIWSGGLNGQSPTMGMFSYATRILYALNGLPRRDA